LAGSGRFSPHPLNAHRSARDGTAKLVEVVAAARNPPRRSFWPVPADLSRNEVNKLFLSLVWKACAGAAWQRPSGGAKCALKEKRYEDALKEHALQSGAARCRDTP